MSLLLRPFEIGSIKAKNRIVMSAMTRGFSPDHHCNDAITNYYASRAEKGVGVILTEGIVIHHSGNGYNDVPFIETESQAESWTVCVKKVQAADASIFAQLWHCGRISHPDYTGGESPVSSSATRAEGINRQNGKEFGVPRSLEADEIPTIIGYFVEAARKAIMAGFDGVELHFGHGYLVDQFLDSRINTRNDTYGGSPANRCRLALEICEAVVSAIGADHVLVRISPSRDMGGIYDWPDLEEILLRLLEGLDRIGIYLLDVSCANADYFLTSGRVIRMARKHWQHGIIGGASLAVGKAEEELRSGYLDLVTWGRAIIANPDIATRIANGAELLPFDNSMRATLV